MRKLARVLLGPVVRWAGGPPTLAVGETGYAVADGFGERAVELSEWEADRLAAEFIRLSNSLADPESILR